jgi:peptidoglycan-associated lipoprotein
MNLLKATVVMILMMVPSVLLAQAVPAVSTGYGLGEGEVPRAEVGLNYNYLRANAPPGQCGCFSLNGGSGTIVYNLRPQWGVVADVALAYAGNVDNTQQNILLFNYLFGVRYTRRNSSRFVPYGQFLFGGAKENVNFDFVINRNAFGFATGGGVTTRLSPHFGLTIAQADWVYTRIPNGKNDRQNDIRISTGVLYRF